MVKTKKVKRQNKGGHGKKKRIFTMKQMDGGAIMDRVNRWRNPTKVSVDPVPYNTQIPSPTPIRSRPSSSANEEGSMFRDVDGTTSATTDSHDTRYNIGNLYPLNEKVQGQHISPGSDLTISPATSPQQTSIQSNTTSSTVPPNDKCLLYVSAWLQNRDTSNKIQIKNQPTKNEYQNFVNDMINKNRLTQTEIDACLQYSNITSQKSQNSISDSTTSTSGSMSSASVARPGHSAFGEPESTTNPPFIEDDGGSRSNPGLPGEARPSWSTNSTEYSDVVSDSTSSTNTDKTYIVKYKLRNGTPQEKEVFVQDPIKKIYSRHLFNDQGTPRSCYFTVPYDQLGTHLNGSIKTTECEIPLTPMGSVR